MKTESKKEIIECLKKSNERLIFSIQAAIKLSKVVEVIPDLKDNLEKYQMAFRQYVIKNDEVVEKNKLVIAAAKRELLKIIEIKK